MAQHDYDIANQSGANFRTDLNNALDAIVSNNSGSSAPSTTFAYEWWIDTSNNLLKLRNSANNAWITLPLSITADNATSGALTVNGNLSTTGTFDVNGGEIILDVDGDTSITSDTDDQIDFRIGGTDVATLTAGTLKIVNTGNTDTLILESTDADANTGPVLVLYRNSASPAQGDLAGEIRFDSEDTAGNQTTIAKIQGILGHPNHGESYAEDGRLAFTIIKDASLTEVMRITEDERVGIGTDDPAYKLDVVHDNVGEGTVAQFGGDGGAGSIPDVRIVNSNQSSGSTDEGARLIFQLGSTNAGWIQAFKEADGTSAGNRSGGLAFYTSNANSVTEKMRISANGAVTIGGSLSKGSGSFKINHPLKSKKDTHDLYHSFVEAPKADNIYRGIANLKNGKTQINLDEVSNMTDGTFIALNREVQCYTSNETDFDSVKGNVTGNILNIECQNLESSATISWLVIGERQDEEIYNSTLTDENGKLIVEKLKSEEE